MIISLEVALGGSFAKVFKKFAKFTGALLSNIQAEITD